MDNVDVLVLGGGINGTAIASEAAERGLRVVLLEREDLASATSSASSKLIHGGLRYLAQAKIALVHESLRERALLLKHAPHLVTPLSFVLPTGVFGAPSWQVRLGLWFYDHLAKRGKLHKSYRLTRSDPSMQALSTDIIRGYCYQDCFGDDARLVISNAIAAERAGAKIYNYVGNYNLTREMDGWQLNLNQPKLSLRSKIVINATGPWVDDVLKSLQMSSTQVLRGVKGSHIVVPRFITGDSAYTLPQPDGRVVFVIPYLKQYSLIGTTDVAFEQDPRTALLSDVERNYLCQAISRYFSVTLKSSDIIWDYSGVRALVADKHSQASKVSREYRLVWDLKAAPMLSVYGGKLTTHRSLAENALNQCQRFFSQLLPSVSASVPLPGGDINDWSSFVLDCAEKYPYLPMSLLERYTHAYGTRLHELLKDKCSLEDLGMHFGGGLYQHEVDFLRQTEWAVTAHDILWRRTKLGLSLTEDEQRRLSSYMTSAE